MAWDVARSVSERITAAEVRVEEKSIMFVVLWRGGELRAKGKENDRESLRLRIDIE